MSDRMTPIPFGQMLEWIMAEHKNHKKIFDVHYPYVAKGEPFKIFGRNLETVVGPAAGPHTQLTQNIVASYYTGSRFFELKTVQILDGEDLPVSKPCIKADDECYNVEWSTELYVPQAMAEYIKAWVLLKFMAKEFGLGSMDGFQFNMSVGYDLEGIKTPKIDKFIETMKDASNDETFKECIQYLKDNISNFKNFKLEDIDAINPDICNSVTLSTLHGCPPAEIERIATYLITEKGLNTFIKCNPTLLGYEFARKTMDSMGYDYIAFGDFHFNDDLQWADAVPMLHRLIALCDEKGLQFGVKITNTFPVDIKAGELPGEEMYMSGKSLYPLSISLAAKLTKEFEGKLRISYSGGADYFNIEDIVGAGIWPVTMATTMLKPGGYQRIKQVAEILDNADREFKGVNVELAQKIAKEAITHPKHVQHIKPMPSRKMEEKVPLVDCFVAPCKVGCPIHQDITSYMQLAGEGKYLEAMEVITERNPLPWITGTICAHNCMTKCTRNFYDDPVHIRDMKLISAKGGYDKLMEQMDVKPITSDKKVAVIGGGSAGLSAAYFTRRAGFATTIFEKENSLGGIVKYVIPGFRIEDEAIDNDAKLVLAQGVDVEYGVEVKSVEELKAKGFDYVIVAIGARMPGLISVEGEAPLNALDFLSDFKASDGKLDLGKNVAIIGAGNTAMDTARAAKKNQGVENSYIVYRRTKRYMPADEEELEMAIDDGVELKELLSPVEFKDGILLCDEMKLGDFDASGRRGIVPTGNQVKLEVDTIIAAVGERVDTEFYKNSGINVDAKGKALLNKDTFETSVEGVFVVGDASYGPATVVEAIRDAVKAAEAIANRELTKDFWPKDDHEVIHNTKAVLDNQHDDKSEADRCLNCAVICENCVEVCPNRANLSIDTVGLDMNQIVHVDYMCNECGNCQSFCPYDSAPYKDKFTLFANAKDFEDSTNQGFMVLDKDTKKVKVRYLGNIFEVDLLSDTDKVEAGLIKTMNSIIDNYDYLLI